jgi:hypothetical protein
MERKMDNHFVGQDKNSGSDSPASTSGGTSLSVRQFCAVAFGWLPVHSPSQPWKVERVAAVRRYCLKCFGERMFDLVEGDGHQVAACRCCGVEVTL